MVHEMIDGTYRQTNLPNESAEYLSKREEVRQAEIELMKQRERVAALRRELPKGATVQVLARDRDWVRVRLEGWVRESDLSLGDTTLRALSAADIRSDPEGSKGKLVQWHVEAVSLQTADALRTGFQPGERYLLALGPDPEKSLVYLAVPESLLVSARSLPPLAQLTVTARVRNGKSEPAGVPILDLQSLTRR